MKICPSLLLLAAFVAHNASADEFVRAKNIEALRELDGNRPGLTPDEAGSMKFADLLMAKKNVPPGDCTLKCFAWRMPGKINIDGKLLYAQVSGRQRFGIYEGNGALKKIAECHIVQYASEKEARRHVFAQFFFHTLPFNALASTIATSTIGDSPKALHVRMKNQRQMDADYLVYKNIAISIVSCSFDAMFDKRKIALAIALGGELAMNGQCLPVQQR